MQKPVSVIPLICVLLALGAGPARAQEQELRGEIVTLDGKASVARSGGTVESLGEGDTVGTGDTIRVAKGASVVLALDGDMKNLVYLDENTDLKVRSIYPTDLEMTQGDVLSKLQALPQGSTYQITTPLGTAVVRGSEFRTVLGQEGMEVLNLEHSNIYVFNQESNGELSETPVVVPQSQRTAVARRGEKPAAAREMSAPQMSATRLKEERMMKGAERRAAGGKPLKIPRIGEVGRLYREKVERGGAPDAVAMQDRMMRRMDGADRNAGQGPVQDRAPQERKNRPGPQNPQNGDKSPAEGPQQGPAGDGQGPDMGGPGSGPGSGHRHGGGHPGGRRQGPAGPGARRSGPGR